MAEFLFISDLHLAPERPDTVAIFLDFLHQRARQAEALYILGDLFDAWIGDDDDEAPYPSICQALKELTASGTTCAILPGNRDFLLGRGFARKTGSVILRDPHRLTLVGTPVILMHGDLLCTDDRAYQRFRRIIRHPLMRRLFLMKSLAKRRAMAGQYRRKSMAAMAGKPLTIMDVNQEAVRALLRRHGSRVVIHGHTHRPGEHCFDLDGQPALRQVLAEWQPERGEVLSFSETGWRRETLRRKEATRTDGKTPTAPHART